MKVVSAQMQSFANGIIDACKLNPSQIQELYTYLTYKLAQHSQQCTVSAQFKMRASPKDMKEYIETIIYRTIAEALVHGKAIDFESADNQFGDMTITGSLIVVKP